MSVFRDKMADQAQTPRFLAQRSFHAFVLTARGARQGNWQ